MNTQRLYVANLRQTTSSKIGVMHFGCISSISSDLVLVEQRNEFEFKNVRTGQMHRTYFGLNDTAIDTTSLRPFNEATGNESKYISKRKALSLFEQRAN